MNTNLPMARLSRKRRRGLSSHLATESSRTYCPELNIHTRDENPEDTESILSSSVSKRRKLQSSLLQPLPPVVQQPGFHPPQPRMPILFDAESRGVHKKTSIQELQSALKDWNAMKEAFHKATALCESHDIVNALPLLRDVIRECQRLLTRYPDPSVIYTTRVPTGTDTETADPPQDGLPVEAQITPTPKRARDRSNGERPTAFHTTFGITLFLMGNIIAINPSLSLHNEPNSPTTYWLAALDVFEAGENLPTLIDGRSNEDASEDWQMALCWGRTLLCLSGAKLTDLVHEDHGLVVQARPPITPTNSEEFRQVTSLWTTGTSFAPEPQWPKDSPFYTIAKSRPPLTRRTYLHHASPHELMTLAMDQFSRGFFRMPHPHPNAIIQEQVAPLDETQQTMQPDPQVAPHSYWQTPFTPVVPNISPPLTPSFEATSSYPRRQPHISQETYSHTHPSGQSFSRSKELFTVASEVLSLAERYTVDSYRLYWALWADSVFNQMKDDGNAEGWKVSVTKLRGKCWLIVGQTMLENMREGGQNGGSFNSDDAKEARDGLSMAIQFFDSAKASAVDHEAADITEISQLLANASSALAHLTSNQDNKAALYSRAKAETEYPNMIHYTRDVSAGTPELRAAIVDKLKL